MMLLCYYDVIISGCSHCKYNVLMIMLLCRSRVNYGWVCFLLSSSHFPTIEVNQVKKDPGQHRCKGRILQWVAGRSSILLACTIHKCAKIADILYSLYVCNCELNLCTNLKLSSVRNCNKDAPLDQVLVRFCTFCVSQLPLNTFPPSD